jgi:hypothetical protein
MIYNIIDRRERPYRWRSINAIIEATSHDNSCDDSDQQPPSDDDLIYDQREGISLSEAISWAHERPDAVTLYIYDEGAGTS